MKRRERGAALVVVLLLLAVMSILVAEFVYAVRIQSSLLSNYEARVKGRAAARAGQTAAAGIISRFDPDRADMFNNPNTGIMLFRYRCITGGDQAMFMALAGGANFNSIDIGGSQTQNTPPPPSTSSGNSTGAQEQCGLWSLGLPYSLEDTDLDIDVSDEQGRLNLNAMITSQVTTPGQGTGGVVDINFTFNRVYFCAIYQLIRYQVYLRKLDVSDVDILDMTTAIMDYLDYGKVDGAFDRDKITTFEIGDQIVPMKDGPLDTVDEIRLVPGMTDELYSAIKDYFTVYPTVFDPSNPLLSGPSPKINLNAAPLEVVFALIMGGGAAGDRCESAMGEEQAMKIANQFIQSNWPGGGASMNGGIAQPQAGAAYQQARNTTLLTEPVRQMAAPSNNPLRFYRVSVTATMPDGQKTTITRVVQADRRQNRIVPIYYREE